VVGERLPPLGDVAGDATSAKAGGDVRIGRFDDCVLRVPG